LDLNLEGALMKPIQITRFHSQTPQLEKLSSKKATTSLQKHTPSANYVKEEDSDRAGITLPEERIEKHMTKMSKINA
jgi:hypothetical protein